MTGIRDEEHEDTMKILSRAAIVLRYREPFLEWAASIDEKAPAHAADLHQHVAVYLMPEDPDEIEECAPLEDWCTDPSLWPSRRDLATFNAWFEVTAESIVLDLAPGRIQTEEF